MRQAPTLNKKTDIRKLLGNLRNKSNYVFLYDNRKDGKESKSYLFTNPIEIISCYKPQDLKKSFLKLEDFISSGYYAAGFVSYEAGLAFEEVFEKYLLKKYSFPLLWFGIYQKPIIYGAYDISDDSKTKFNDYSLKNPRLNISENEYAKNIFKIKNYIAKGQTYQINYTVKYKFTFKGLAQNLFLDLCRKQHVHYSAFIDCDNFQILSLSPELFFKRHNERVILKPMKGTLDRGFGFKGDFQKAKELKNSLKNRAENIMIVDLIRNDIGRVSVYGEVITRSIFDIEKYDTLFQMTSTVASRLKKDISWYELFRNIFPSGSVTGAPKIRTMQIIESLEKEPRYVYTGSIGFISPKKEGIFNVAIRTVLIDKKRKNAEMGIGSGIVWDSDAKKEYEECNLKSKFLTESYCNFQLIETMLWRKPEGFFLLDYHLRRLGQSAKYFGFAFDKGPIIKQLIKEAKLFDKTKNHRVRLLLYKDGSIAIESRVLSGSDGLVKIALSKKKTNSLDNFLFHKTTRRKLYNDEYKKYKRQGFYDVVFINENNQMTEGAISNIFIKTNGIFYTPPVSCGLLEGTFRKYLIENKSIPIKEKVLYRDDLLKADKIYLTNAVRGMVEVKLYED